MFYASGVFALGIVFGLVISLVFDIRRAIALSTQASLIGGGFFQFFPMYEWGISGGDIFSLVVIYIFAVIVSVPFGVAGVALGALIRYLAGLIVGTYKIPH
ncbi:MAG: hypothetical protein M3275_10655 [Thermoproteota archaeon]|nr:hypothetical protein [Thermoproteota archaeon]